MTYTENTIDVLIATDDEFNKDMLPKIISKKTGLTAMAIPKNKFLEHIKDTTKEYHYIVYELYTLNEARDMKNEFEEINMKYSKMNYQKPTMIIIGLPYQQSTVGKILNIPSKQIVYSGELIKTLPEFLLEHCSTSV